MTNISQVQEALLTVCYGISIPLWLIIIFNWINQGRWGATLLGASLLLRLVVMLCSTAFTTQVTTASFAQNAYTAVAVLVPLGLTAYLYESRKKTCRFWLERDKNGPTQEGSGRFLVFSDPRGSRGGD